MKDWRHRAVTGEAIWGADLNLAPDEDTQINELAALDGEVYAQAWLAALASIGGHISGDFTADGGWRMMSGVPCDGQERERSRRLTVLIEDIHARGLRDSLVAFLQQHGQYADNRPETVDRLTPIVLGFVDLGGRLLITPAGILEVAGDSITALEDGEFAAAWRHLPNRTAIRSIVSAHGSDARGWIVLERRAAPAGKAGAQ